MAQLARGEHDSVSAAPSPSSPPPPPQESVSDAFAASKEAYHEDSDGNNSNVGHPKKPAWSKPLNGVVPVMGDAVSWPALSEATKSPSKSTPDVSNPNESVSASQGPVTSNPTQNQKKHANTNSNPNSAANPKSPARQRSSKRGGGTRAGPVQNGFIRAPPPPPPLPLPPPPPIFPLFDLPYGALPAVPDYFPYNGNNWEGMPMGGFVPQSSSASYQSSPRSSSRRGNFGGHHNGRNASRSSNVRDVRVPQQIAPPRGFLRPAPPPPPPGSIPFIRPHHVGPFGYPMGFDMTFPFVYVPTPPMESFNEVPFSAQAPPMPPLSSTVLDDPMRASLVNQIEYYFCDDNLSRDNFLRSKMDDEGWVPISLIAGFPKVQQWTNDIEVIFNSLKASSVVEVQPHKVRRRDEWKKWVFTPSRFAAGSSTEKTITSSLLKVTLDEAAANKSSVMSEADSSTKVVPCTSTSEELTGHANLANGDTTIEESCSSHI